MSKSGERILRGAREALAFARGEEVDGVVVHTFPDNAGDASAGSISRKLRRALRNDTGTRFTASELRLMADLGVLRLLLEAEENELRQRWQRHPKPRGGSSDRHD